MRNLLFFAVAAVLIAACCPAAPAVCSSVTIDFTGAVGFNSVRFIDQETGQIVTADNSVSDTVVVCVALDHLQVIEWTMNHTDVASCSVFFRDGENQLSLYLNPAGSQTALSDPIHVGTHWDFTVNCR